MQIVIDIDDDMYKSVVNNDAYVLEDVDWILLENAIANGTPLPEHHGRLIDAEKLIKRINDAEENFKADNEYQTDDSFGDGVLSGVFNIRAMVQQAANIIEGSDKE